MLVSVYPLLYGLPGWLGWIALILSWVPLAAIVLVKVWAERRRA